jgi:hypothetical protein
MRGVLLAMLVAGAAHADPVIEARGVCDTTALPARVATLATTSSRTHVSVATEARADGVAAKIAVGNDARVIEARDCAALIDATALVIAMALQPSADQHHDDERPGRVLIERPVEIAAPSGPSRLSLIGGASYASTRMESAVVGARFRDGDQSLGIEVDGTRPVQIAITPLASVSIWEASASVVPCIHRGTSAWCGVLTAGVSHGSSERLNQPHAATSPLLALGTRVAWEYPDGAAVALRIHADLTARVTSSHFDVDDMPIWQSSRIEAQAGAALIVRFP